MQPTGHTDRRRDRRKTQGCPLTQILTPPPRMAMMPTTPPKCKAGVAYTNPPSNPSDSQGSPSHGKLSAVVLLLKWSSLGQGTSLPSILKMWHTSTPKGTVCKTQEISGKFLCFKFCTEGLFCKTPAGCPCVFTHIDLAQPRLWT